MVILSIIAISGGAYIVHVRAETYAQNQRVKALEVAHERLEQLFATSYDAIKPFNLDYANYYLQGGGTNWTVTVSDPNETYAYPGGTLPIQTIVRYQDLDGGLASYDCLHVIVSAGFRAGSPERVRQETYLGP